MQNEGLMVDSKQWQQILHESNRVHVRSGDMKKQKGMIVLANQNTYEKQYARCKNFTELYFKQFDRVMGEIESPSSQMGKYIDNMDTFSLQIYSGLEEVANELAFLNLRSMGQLIIKLKGMLEKINDSLTNYFKYSIFYKISFNDQKETTNQRLNICDCCKRIKDGVIIDEMKKKFKMQIQPINQFRVVIDEEDQFLYNERINYLNQLEQILKKKDTFLDVKASTHTFLMKEIVNFSDLKYKNIQYQQNVNEIQILTEQVKDQLFTNFLKELSEPLREIFKRNKQNQKRLSKNKRQAMIHFGCQTYFGVQIDRIRLLQKALHQKTNEANVILVHKNELQKKLLNKIDVERSLEKENLELRKNNRELNEQMQKTIYKLNNQLENYQHLKLQKENEFQRIRLECEEKCRIIKVEEERKRDEYRLTMNKRTEQKIGIYIKKIEEMHKQYEGLKTSAQNKNHEEPKAKTKEADMLIVSKKNSNVLDEKKQSTKQTVKQLTVKRIESKTQILGQAQNIITISQKQIDSKLQKEQKITASKVNISFHQIKSNRKIESVSSKAVKTNNISKQSQFEQITSFVQNNAKQNQKPPQKYLIKRSNKQQLSYYNTTVVSENISLYNAESAVNTSLKKHNILTKKNLLETQKIKKKIAFEDQQKQSSKYKSSFESIKQSLKKVTNKKQLSKMSIKSSIRESKSASKSINQLTSIKCFLNSKYESNDADDLDIEKALSILKEQFLFFKEIGLVKMMQNLDIQEISLMKKQINLLQPKYKNQNLSKSKSKLLKKDIVEYDQKQHKMLLKTQIISQQLELSDLQNVGALSQINQSDLQLIGGVSEMQNYEMSKNFWRNETELCIDNHFYEQTNKIVTYFKLLKKIDEVKFQLYYKFLFNPRTALNQNELRSSVQLNESELRLKILKIFKFHQIQHSQNCLHIPLFLKKIGYYRYSPYM